MRESIEKITLMAGDFLYDNFGKDPGLLGLRSTAKDAVTEYDKISDEMIIRKIREVYPEHSLLTEESGFLEGNPDWIWIVDSLDGTGDFADFNPFFSVCIAVMYKGEIILGTVYAPAVREFYIAEKGKGAYLNKKKIQVSPVSEIKQSYVFHCEGGEKDRARTMNVISKVYPEVMDFRKLGSAGLETAWVAAGKGEAYLTTKIEPWDVASGVLLIREAGGEVSDFAGKQWKMEQSDLVFSNGYVHRDILNLINS